MDRLPCLSPSYRISSNLCPLSQWCHPIISSSVAPFSSCPQSFPASGSYNIELLFSWDDGGEHLKRAHYTFYKGFPSGSVVKKKKKKSTWNAGNAGLMPGLGRSLGGGNGSPLQKSCLENPTDKEAWWASVHGVAKESDTTVWPKTKLTHPMYQAMSWMLGKYYFISFAQGPIVRPILQMRKLTEMLSSPPKGIQAVRGIRILVESLCS